MEEYSVYLQKQCSAILKDMLYNDEEKFILKNLIKIARYINPDVSTNFAILHFLSFLISKYYTNYPLSGSYIFTDYSLKATFGIKSTDTNNMRKELSERKIIKYEKVESGTLQAFRYELIGMELIKMMVAYE